MVLLGDHRLDLPLAHERDAVEAAAVAERSIDSRDAARVAVAAAACDLDRAPLAPVHRRRPRLGWVLLEGEGSQRGLIGAVLRREELRVHVRHYFGDERLLLVSHAADVVLGTQR